MQRTNFDKCNRFFFVLPTWLPVETIDVLKKDIDVSKTKMFVLLNKLVE